MKNKIFLCILIIFGIISIVDLLHPGFAVTHDGQDHIARIANFYMNLQQGILIPRWAANLNWGYGHPILEFLYPFPSYIASLFHFLGFSLIDSTKLVYGLAMIASGVAMYVFVRKQWGDSAGVVSGILYMYAPYRLVDLYVRGDIGEHVAFVFIPLVFLGLNLVNTQKQKFGSVLFATICLALLILSHNAIALMVMPLILLYGMYLLWQKKWNRSLLLWLSTVFVLGLLVSGFFWIPGLFEGQYTLRNIVTKGEYITRFVTLAQLLYGKWSYGQTGMFTVQLGLVHWVFLLVSVGAVFEFWKKDKKIAVLLIGLIASTAVAIFLMLPLSNFLWQRIMLLQNFQFPWRFLAIPVFTTSLMAGICISQLSSLYKKIIVITVCILILFLSKDSLHAREYSQKPEDFFTGIYDGTTDTGESAPIWSVRFMGQRFDKPMNLIDGNVQITEEKRLVAEHSYNVSSQGKSRLVENTLYFPGWRIFVDGKQTNVEFQDIGYRGLMTFYVENGTHSVDVVYQESKLRFTGDIVSIIGIFGILSLYIFTKRKKNL